MADETRDPHVLAPGRAPTPFTADEVRGGCPAGRTIRLRVDVVGETSFHRVSRFVECDEAGATWSGPDCRSTALHSPSPRWIG